MGNEKGARSRAGGWWHVWPLYVQELRLQKALIWLGGIKFESQARRLGHEPWEILDCKRWRLGSDQSC